MTESSLCRETLAADQIPDKVLQLLGEMLLKGVLSSLKLSAGSTAGESYHNL